MEKADLTHQLSQMSAYDPNPSKATIPRKPQITTQIRFGIFNPRTNPKFTAQLLAFVIAVNLATNVYLNRGLLEKKTQEPIGSKPPLEHKTSIPQPEQEFTVDSSRGTATVSSGLFTDSPPDVFEVESPKGETTFSVQLFNKALNDVYSLLKNRPAGTITNIKITGIASDEWGNKTGSGLGKKDQENIDLARERLNEFAGVFIEMLIEKGIPRDSFGLTFEIKEVVLTTEQVNQIITAADMNNKTVPELLETLDNMGIPELANLTRGVEIRVENQAPTTGRQEPSNLTVDRSGEPDKQIDDKTEVIYIDDQKIKINFALLLLIGLPILVDIQRTTRPLKPLKPEVDSFTLHEKGFRGKQIRQKAWRFTPKYMWLILNTFDPDASGSKIEAVMRSTKGHEIYFVDHKPNPGEISKYSSYLSQLDEWDISPKLLTVFTNDVTQPNAFQTTKTTLGDPTKLRVGFRIKADKRNGRVGKVLDPKIEIINALNLAEIKRPSNLTDLDELLKEVLYEFHTEPDRTSKKLPNGQRFYMVPGFYLAPNDVKKPVPVLNTYDSNQNPTFLPKSPTASRGLDQYRYQIKKLPFTGFRGLVPRSPIPKITSKAKPPPQKTELLGTKGNSL